MRSQTERLDELYPGFFQPLIDTMRERHSWTRVQTVSGRGHFDFGAGFSGFTYCVSFARGERLRVELKIDKGDIAFNKACFDRLLAERTAIEREFGFELAWERIDSKPTSRIAWYTPASIRNSEAELSALRRVAEVRLLTFREVFTPWLRVLIADLC